MAKRRRTTALGAVIRFRNRSARLMMTDYNLHQVKIELSEYDKVFLQYIRWSMNYIMMLSCLVMSKIKITNDTMTMKITWIQDAENRSSDTTDRSSEPRLTHTRSRH